MHQFGKANFYSNDGIVRLPALTSTVNSHGSIKGRSSVGECVCVCGGGGLVINHVWLQLTSKLLGPKFL